VKEHVQIKKHIVLVIRSLNGRSGGAERIYCELANILDESGYRVTCLHFDPKPGEPFYHINYTVERINIFGKADIWVRRRAAWSNLLPSGMREKAAWDKENSFFVQQLNDYFRLVKPDIAISILPPANTPTLLAAAGTTVKVVACNHNVPEQDYNNPKRWGQSALDRRLRLEALDNSAAIHVLFPDFGRWFPAHLQDRIVAIPNYISPDFKWPDPKPQKEKVILAVGRLAEVKNYMQLLRSWATVASEFPDWKVRIFGVGPQLKEMKEEIGKLGLRGRVDLLGHLSDLSSEYAKASIFCHPALFEGFGLSPAEALYLETPVLFFADCAGVNEFVRDGYNGLAVERNPGHDHLADGMRRLMEDESFRNSLGANGPASVSAFTLDRYKDGWISLIDKLGNNV
jgi:glycosyltransferase involved in cell wall biosynthesis